MSSARRHESLIPLSREHHYGLMLCLRIHRGLPLDGKDEEWVRAKAAQALGFFASDLTAHFKAEEEVLFPAMQGFAGAPPLLSELLSEHRELNRLAAQLSGSDVATLKDVLGKFADLLEAHIRKEERELFPLYEKEVGVELAEEEGRAVKDVVGEAMQPLTSTALFVSAAGVAGKAALDSRGEQAYAPMKIEGAEALAPGSALNFTYPTQDETAILVRAADGQYFACGQKCTHLACPVYYEQRRQRLECPCHEGSFDVRSGNVLYGPPPHPLDQIVLEERGGEVWAVGRKAGTHGRSV